MRKKIINQAAIICLFLLSFPVIARADFFDDSDGKWYMNSSWWGSYVDDPENRTTLVDQSDRLEWITTPGWSGEYDAFRAYGSKWAFDLSDDFEFTVGFHYDHNGNYDTDEGGIEMGLYHFDDPNASKPSHTFSISAANWVSTWSGGGLSNKNVFWSSMELPDQEANSWWERNNTDGMLYARYNANEDELDLQALESSYPEWKNVGGSSYHGLKSEMGLNQLGVYFAGWSEGAGLASGDAYLENFVKNKGTITPEPVSSILFLIGGLSLAGFRYYKRKREIAL